jgi:hypothetical protein
VTFVDIGDGGLGIITTAPLTVGDVLSFRVQLPDTPRAILVARVLWDREWSRYGCEFVPIPPVDLMILQHWLKAEQRVKKLVTEL